MSNHPAEIESRASFQRYTADGGMLRECPHVRYTLRFAGSNYSKQGLPYGVLVGLIRLPKGPITEEDAKQTLLTAIDNVRARLRRDHVRVPEQAINRLACNVGRELTRAMRYPLAPPPQFQPYARSASRALPTTQETP